MKLGVHPYADACSFRETRRHIALEQEFSVINVGSELRFRRRAKDTILVEHGGVQEIIHTFPATGDTEVGVLVHCRVLKEDLVPVIVREDVPVQSRTRSRNLFLRPVLHPHSLVVGLHICHTISDFLHTRRH